VLVDEQTYPLRPGCLPEYLARHLQVALPLVREYLGELLAYFTSVDGELNQFVHLSAYVDAADRELRCARLYADARWLAYRHETGATGWVQAQSNRLLNSLPRAARASRMRSVRDESIHTLPRMRVVAGAIQSYIWCNANRTAQHISLASAEAPRPLRLGQVGGVRRGELPYSRAVRGN